MAGSFDDDEYVANLLKEDAEKAAKKYELVGMDAFNPTRVSSGAPKPNTSFLRHIIRQTDSHNTALLAKEAQEAKARLELMNQEEREKQREAEKKKKKADGRLTPVPSDDDTPGGHLKRRSRFSEDSENYDRSYRGRQRDAEVPSRRQRDRSRDVLGDNKRNEEDDDPSARSRRRPRTHHDKERRHRNSSEERRHRYGSEEQDDRSRKRSHRDHSHRRHRSRSRVASRSPRSYYHERRRKRQDRSRSPPTRRPETSRDPKHRHRKRTRSASPAATDSDPLEEIIGPLPPPTQPLARGRGAQKAKATGIDSRFSSTYDPTTDVQPPSDNEDDWGDALETLRDRKRWKEQGAERLKAAGFTDNQVKNWEKGDEPAEVDVVWTHSGVAREWDRGKVLDIDGSIALKAELARFR